MEYLERCIKESLRLYPPVPVISRLLTKDLQLSINSIFEVIALSLLNHSISRGLFNTIIIWGHYFDI